LKPAAIRDGNVGRKAILRSPKGGGNLEAHEKEETRRLDSEEGSSFNLPQKTSAKTRELVTGGNPAGPRKKKIREDSVRSNSKRDESDVTWSLIAARSSPGMEPWGREKGGAAQQKRGKNHVVRV